MSHYYLNEDHSYRPCSLMEWASQLDTLTKTDKKHVADEVIEGVRVSTVWLGLDHNYFGGRPLLFETMVFNAEGSDIYCERYTTWEQAESGHNKAVEWVKDGCKDE